MTTERSGSEAFRVLVVTDNQAVHDEFAFGFPAEVEVSFAHDSRDAWPLLRAKTPSAVIVDLQTGSAGGYNLAKEMSSSHDLAKVPIVMLLERDQDAWLARQAGASRYHPKPVTAVEILDDLRALTG